MNKSILIAVVAALLPLVWGQCLSPNETRGLSADKLYYGQRKFTVSLLSSLHKALPNDSLFFSPHSTYRALLLAYFGAKGETEKAIKNTLQLDWASNKEHVAQAYNSERLARANRVQDDSVEFKSVDKLYVSQQVEVR